MFSTLSIKSQILGTLLLVFASIMAVTTIHTLVSERALVRNVVIEKITDTAYAYFDGVNTMMLTGTMNQRETLRNKLLKNNDIQDIRLLRGEHINKVFGPGLEHEQAQDELDWSVLAGEEIILENETDGADSITILKPILASSNYRGTNCLTCHQVPEGTVLGGIRVSYSLANLHGRIAGNILNSGLINAGMFGLGIGTLVVLLHFLVFKRLSSMQDTMLKIEKDSNLGLRMNDPRQDEIGAVNSAIDVMLQRFYSGIQQMAQMGKDLSRSSERIATVAADTSSGAAEQQAQTISMATAINEMEASAQSVHQSAGSTAKASENATDSAHQGAELAQQAIAGISQLVEELHQAEQVIVKLDEHSRNVGSVLDVIKGIAEQTNLLALNAAIEAARAGEQGRGFAVVADEVRTLANRSQTSTQEIQGIIEQLQLDAHRAVDTMGEARASAEARSRQITSATQSLSEIVDQVTHINTLNAQVANAAREQSLVTEEVNESVNSISLIADRTAKGAGETNQASLELKELVSTLETMLQQYRLQ
jgi:methyl-accepting chemotaxis protein